MNLPFTEAMLILGHRGFELFIFGKIFIEKNRNIDPIPLNKYETLVAIEGHKIFDKSLEEIAELDDEYLSSILLEVRNSIKLIYHISHKYIDEEESNGEFKFNDSNTLTTASLKTLKTTDYFVMDQFTAVREGKLPVTFEWRRDDNYEIVQSITVSPYDIHSPFNDKDDYETIINATSTQKFNLTTDINKRAQNYVSKAEILGHTKGYANKSSRKKKFLLSIITIFFFLIFVELMDFWKGLFITLYYFFVVPIFLIIPIYFTKKIIIASEEFREAGIYDSFILLIFGIGGFFIVQGAIITIILALFGINFDEIFINIFTYPLIK